MYRSGSDPYHNLAILKDQVNRLFETVLTRSDDSSSRDPGAQWTPLVDLYETDSEVVLVAEVPGLSRDDLDVQVTDSAVTLRGDRRRPEENEAIPQRLERAHGAFSRTFHLSSSIEREKVTAEYRLGLLKVTLPKKERSSPRSVRVNKA